MRDKIIGYFTTKLQDEDNLIDFEVVHKHAYEKNYGVITYYLEMEWIGKDKVKAADSYYMVNYDMLDAIIIDAQKVNDTELIRKFVQKAKNANIPAYVFHDDLGEGVCIATEVEPAFEELIDHMITVHDCKKICLLLGFPGKYNSDKLIDIYKKKHLEYGIPYDEKRIGYGHYWIDYTKKTFPELIADGIPDAICCANDTMAMTVCNILKEMNIRVPEDVKVTGIDKCIRGDYFTPVITTIGKDPEVIISTIFNHMEQDFAQGVKEETIKIKSPVWYSESCGCVNNLQVDYVKKINEMYERMNEDVVRVEMHTNMTEWLMQVSTISDVSKAVEGNIPEDSFLCVRDSFMQDVFQVDSIETNPLKNEKFYILADRRNTPKTWGAFPVKDLCPSIEKMLETDIPVIIAPVRYQDAHFGYLIVQSPNYKLRCSILEQSVYDMASLFGRYVSDRRLRFANSELFHAHESVRRLQHRDILTGLFNTHGFVEEMQNICEYCVETGDNLILACIDLDRLGNINDIYGHSEGDVAIQTLASIVQDAAGEEYVCAHIGSDEFMVGLHCKEDSEKLMESFFYALDNRVENYNRISEKEYSLELNQIYVTFHPDETTDIKKCIDEAMGKKQLAKLSRRGIVEHKHEQDDDASREEYLAIKDVIDNNRFKYAYQPIINARNGEVFAYEALMRTDTEKFISPLSILKHAADVDRLYEIEKATFFNVLNQVADCQNQIEGRKVFLNSIPGYQLDSMDYAKIKRKYGTLFEDIVVEITEQTEMNDDGFGLIRKRSGKEGFEVAIDDFGSGYSNTSSLLKYLPNYVKIDRLLISNIHDEPKKQHFVKNIIEFAHENGFLALAEGVETAEELRAVIHMDVDLIQGFYTAKPSFEFIDSIDPKVKHEILEANVSGYSTLKKKVYIVNKEHELLLMRLALEQYTGIIVSQEELTIIGNPDYSAGMVIKIRDDCNCKLKLKNVKLASEDDNPCISLGNNTNLILECEDNNELLQCGIYVPESSTLTLIGDGNLKIAVSGSESFGIGSRWNSRVGNVICKMDGGLSIKSDGNKCIGIGGGSTKEGRISIEKGKIDISVYGVDGIGIGYAEKGGEISIKECNIDMGIRVANGVGIGCFYEDPHIKMENFRIRIEESGNILCGLGGLGCGGGDVTIDSGRLIIEANGRNTVLVGNKGGDIIFDVAKARFDLRGEGSECVGVGNEKTDARLNIIDATMNVSIRSENRIFIGAKEGNVKFENVIRNYEGG